MVAQISEARTEAGRENHCESEASWAVKTNDLTGTHTYPMAPRQVTS